MRWVMAGIGALAGLCFHALFEAWADGSLPERLMLFLSVGGLAFFAGLLVMAGLIGPRRAALAALGTALPAAGLIVWASLRYDDTGDLIGPSEGLAAFLLALLPWPFWIAGFRGNWLDYPTHFRESWSAVIRATAGLVFTGLVWAVIWLSDALLSLVGLEIITDLIRIDVLPYVVTGAVTGLAMAVVAELSDVLSPDLLLRLLRLLVPVVLGVMAVFLVALPLRGFDSVLGGVSVAGTLLAMAGVAITLVAVACDMAEGRPRAQSLMERASQALAALIVVPGGLAVWALALRVAEAGWTPPRVAGVVAATVAVGYGLGYLWALAGGRRWRIRVRRANLVLALAIIGLSALWLTPVLDATAISARSQIARYEAGRTPVDRLDLAVLEEWGVEGAAALDRLEALAKEPGQEALATRLADRDQWATSSNTPSEATKAALLRVLQVVPADATDQAASVVESLQTSELRNWQKSCGARLPDGRAACVLVLADLLPEWPPADPAAPEAVFLWLAADDWLFQTTLVRKKTGPGWDNRGPGPTDGRSPGNGAAAIAAVLSGGPVLEPVPLRRRLRLDDRTITIYP